MLQTFGSVVGHDPLLLHYNKKQPAAARSQEDSVIEFSFSFRPNSGERCTKELALSVISITKKSPVVQRRLLGKRKSDGQ